MGARMKAPTFSYKQACAAAMSQPHAVNYRFTDGDGVQCHGRTVSHGRDQAHAERRFFRQHRHVSPVLDESTNPDTN
jgi:hypothetical protein